MKKYILLLLIWILWINTALWASHCSDSNISYLKEQLNLCKSEWYICNLSTSEIENLIEQEESRYQECLKEESRINNFNTLLEKANSAFDNGNYKEAISLYKAMKNYDDWTNTKTLNNAIWRCYFNIWNEAFNKKDYNLAISNYKECLNLVPDDPSTLYNIWISYVYLWDAQAITYLDKAKSLASDSELIENIKKVYPQAQRLAELEESKKHQRTNDPLAYKQYYLSWLNIFSAREKLPLHSTQVIIAIIDDWVDTAHPDLSENIRTNQSEISWNWLDDDKNGYIDDIHWRNFTDNSGILNVKGKHWTMVAGIIAWKLNNNIWIAWITPNVKIIPLVVGDIWGKADGYYIAKAIDYAIDNWANIINISLWGDRWDYKDIYSEYFKKANEKGIIVVVAAWNWDNDTSENSNWINTSVNKISPVCDEVNEKTVIWVWALKTDGTLTKRSNFGSCVDVYSFWEEVYSTTVNSFEKEETRENEPYNYWAWTSFAAPMIAWIIGLWYNIYWKIDPTTVFDALKNAREGNTINTVKYLNNLSATIGELNQAITWMHEKGLTIHDTPKTFKYANPLRRDEAAKFFVQYAKEVLWKKPDYNKENCNFKDLDKAWSDLRNIAIESCQLWLFQWSNWYFKPDSQLSNAQAITVFMRLLKGYMDESWSHYANKYFSEAWNLGLISWTALGNRNNFDISATRWDVALMLYRWRNK